MINLNRLEDYRENNRIEAKRATGGFPQSVWETYSAFANTMGGIILLGVAEHADHSLHAVNLPDPQALIEELWRTLNDGTKVSANVLTAENAVVTEVDGKSVVVITVPRAQRAVKPIYIGGNPFGGTYRRNGEGDYRCSKEEVEAMLRDAAEKPQDGEVLGDVSMQALNPDSVEAFFNRVKALGRESGNVGDDFLQRIGAAAVGADGVLHPTAAGLLAFGFGEEILKKYPSFSLRANALNGCTAISSNCAATANVSDFYFAVREGLLNTAYDEEVKRALCEALANCLTNADYCGEGGVTVTEDENGLTFSNPGSFRIDVRSAQSGGVSDPRNGVLGRLLASVGGGKGTGSGIPHIYSVWKKHGWQSPVIFESFAPERIKTVLPLNKAKRVGRQLPSAAQSLLYKAATVDYLTDNASATVEELAEYLNLPQERAFELFAELEADDIVVGDEGGYRLKR